MANKLTKKPKGFAIKPYPKNAKKHPKDQLYQIALSLREYGWRQPIVVDKNDEIIVGHGRWMAYQEFPKGIKEPWVIKADDLTPEQVRGYRLMDNKTNESDWDMALVIEELKELDDLNFDISLTGFDSDLLIYPEEKDDVIPDDAPTRAKLGDLWLLGEHRVLCGDATKQEDVEKLMGGVKADMVFTDPPYNVAYTGMVNSKQWKGLDNDAISTAGFKEFLTSAIKNIYDNTKGEAALYLCHADKTHNEFRQAFEDAGYDWRVTIIWVKNSPAFNFAQYKYAHEPIFYCFKKGKVVSWYGDLTRNTVWHEKWNTSQIVNWYKKQISLDKEKAKTTVWEAKKEHGDHPTIKPVELINKAIVNSSKQDDLILDPFLGSGSTLVAAEKSGRICYGMELEPKYVDVILKRWEDYTGQTATLWQK